MREKAKYRAGIDLGGTKIEIVVLNDNKDECYRQRLPLQKHENQNEGYKSVIKTIDLLIKNSVDKLKIKPNEVSVGINSPGYMNKSGVMKNSHKVYLNDKFFLEDLQKEINRPFKIDNDANCFTLSEAIDGAAAGAQCVFGVILGTGCGGGTVFNGQIITGANANAGEWGHNPLPSPDSKLGEFDGVVCGDCGNKGCIETWISGSGLSRDYKKATGLVLSAKEISKLALDNDKNANAVLERYKLRVAKSLATIINIVDPDIIVFGGGLSNIESLYIDVPKMWKEYIYTRETYTKLVPPKFGDASGARGAAWLWESLR